MQYPLAKLEKAVNKVLSGEMKMKKASKTFGVPRSTISRRLMVQKGLLPQPKRRAFTSSKKGLTESEDGTGYSPDSPSDLTESTRGKIR